MTCVENKGNFMEFKLAVGTYTGKLSVFKISLSSKNIHTVCLFDEVIHKDIINNAFWMNENLLLTGSNDESMKICNLATNEFYSLSIGKRGSVYLEKIKTSNNSNYIQNVSRDGTVAVWDFDYKNLIFDSHFLKRNRNNKKIEVDIEFLAANPVFEGLFAVAFFDGDICLFTNEKKNVISNVYSKKDFEHNLLYRATQLQWNSDGKYLFILTKISVISLKLETGEKSVHVKNDSQSSYTCFAVHDNMMVIGLNNGEIKYASIIINKDTDNISFKEFKILNISENSETCIIDRNTRIKYIVYVLDTDDQKKYFFVQKGENKLILLEIVPNNQNTRIYEVLEHDDRITAFRAINF